MRLRELSCRVHGQADLTVFPSSPYSQKSYERDIGMEMFAEFGLGVEPQPYRAKATAPETRAMHDSTPLDVCRRSTINVSKHCISNQSNKNTTSHEKYMMPSACSRPCSTVYRVFRHGLVVGSVFHDDTEEAVCVLPRRSTMTRSRGWFETWQILSGLAHPSAAGPNRA